MVCVMDVKYKKKLKRKIFFWFLFLYLSACGTYTNNNPNAFEEPIFLYGLIDFLIISLILMLIPFITYLVDDKTIEYNRGLKIFKWNSVIWCLVSIVLMVEFDFGLIGILGAVVYYYLNKWIFIDIPYANNNIYPENIAASNVKMYKCNNCGMIVNEFEKDRHICSDAIKNGVSTKFKCDNCGTYVSENDVICPGCCMVFENEDYENCMCSNCGAIINDSDIKCFNCGESFIEEPKPEINNIAIKEDFDDKYDKLIKLKDLYDKKILSKEEFDNEKSKILESNK